MEGRGNEQLGGQGEREEEYMGTYSKQCMGTKPAAGNAIVQLIITGCNITSLHLRDVDAPSCQQRFTGCSSGEERRLCGRGPALRSAAALSAAAR